jgi:sortase (surface protein transpeptidase)
VIRTVPNHTQARAVENARIISDMPSARNLALAATAVVAAGLLLAQFHGTPGATPPPQPVAIQASTTAVASTSTSTTVTATSTSTEPSATSDVTSHRFDGRLTIPSVGIDAEWTGDDGSLAQYTIDAEFGLVSLYSRPACSREHGLHVLGHRTTHTHPFLALGQVVVGADINVSSGDQSCVYRVTGTRVEQDNVDAPGTLTVWTCAHEDGTPGGSNWRLVVDAQLVAG